MQRLNTAMMARYEIDDHRPARVNAVQIGLGEAMLGTVNRLIDDYNANLRDWAESAVAIKYLNGINNRHGSWKGRTAAGCASQIAGAVYDAIASVQPVFPNSTSAERRRS